MSLQIYKNVINKSQFCVKNVSYLYQKPTRIDFCKRQYWLFHQLEVAGGVLAPGTDEVGGKLVAFVDIAADVADPLLFV